MSVITTCKGTGERVVGLFIAPTTPAYENNTFYICDVLWWEIVLEKEGAIGRFPIIINPDCTNEVIRATEMNPARWVFTKILEIGQDFNAQEHTDLEAAEAEYSRMLEAKQKIDALNQGEVSKD
jgi:hypothetical protein